MKLKFLWLEKQHKVNLQSFLKFLINVAAMKSTLESGSDNASTQFLYMPKNLPSEEQEQSDGKRKTLPVFVFNRAKYDINFVKAFSFLFLVLDETLREFLLRRPICLSRSIVVVFICSTFWTFGGGTNLESWLKLWKTLETIAFSLLLIQSPRHFEIYWKYHLWTSERKILYSSHPGKEYQYHKKRTYMGLTSDSTLVKSKIFEVPPTAAKA